MAKTESGNKPKKEKKKGRFVRWFKEMGSELKKVSWPTMAQTLKKTGVVLLVVLLFLLVLVGIDQLLSLLFGLLTSGLSDGAATESLIGGVAAAFSKGIGGSLWL